MVDLHVHILPGVDDGPSSWEVAEEMARAAFAQGVRLLVATPHLQPAGYPFRTPVDVLRARTADLNRRLQAQQVDLQVILGAENLFSADLRDRLARGEALPIGDTRYIFVEMPGDTLPIAVDDHLFSIQIDGYEVILAHPERYRYVQTDLKVAERWVERDIHLQVNADSLLGRQGGRMKQVAETLVRSRLADIVASDAHDPVERPPALADAGRRLVELVGPAEARRLLQVNPARVVGDEPLEPPEEAEPTSFGQLMSRARRLLSRVRRRIGA